MATTSNNGWPVPVSTDLVRNGYDAINDLGAAIDSDLGKLFYINISPTSAGTGWVLGTGNSRTGNWARLGKTVHFDGEIVLGTSCVAGSGAFAVDLPVNSSTNTVEFLGNGLFTDDSTGDLYPCTIRISGNFLYFYIPTVASAKITLKTFDNTNKPVTLASGDKFTWSVTYQGV